MTREYVTAEESEPEREARAAELRTSFHRDAVAAVADYTATGLNLSGNQADARRVQLEVGRDFEHPLLIGKPNDSTLEAIAELETGGNTSFASVDVLMADLRDI